MKWIGSTCCEYKTSKANYLLEIEWKDYNNKTYKKIDKIYWIE